MGVSVVPWLPGFTRVDLDQTGIQSPEVGRPYDEMSHPKICLHTTEGPSLAGAERAFALYPPHIGVDPKTGARHQYLPIDRCSFSLKGSENDDEFVVQVEIVGFAASPPSGTQCDWLGQQVVGPIARAIGCPLVAAPQGFHGAGEGFVVASASSPIRFKSEGALRAFSGVMGHQHAPSPDTHWDPGKIDVARILRAAEVEDDVTPQDIEKIAQRVLERINGAYEQSGSVIRQQSRVLSKLGTDDSSNSDLEDPGRLGLRLDTIDTKLAKLEELLTAPSSTT